RLSARPLSGINSTGVFFKTQLYVICLCLCVFCITDRLFGQCRSSRQDQVQYQVSVPVLQRLQEVLKELMMQGTHKHSPFSAHYSSLIYRALSKLSMFNSQQNFKTNQCLCLLKGCFFHHQHTENNATKNVCLFIVLCLFFSLHSLFHCLCLSLSLSLLLSSFSTLSVSPQRSEGLPQATRIGDGSRGVVLTMVAMACVGAVVLVALTIACLRHHARQLASGKLGLGPEAGAETHFDYQELCRQHMAAKSSFSRPEPGGRRGTDTSRVSSVSSQFSDGPQHSPSSHSSTPSWSEEPAQSNMDISTGHMILAYMEDHLKNKDRLQKEWEALCSYQAEPSSVSIAQNERNLEKNRYPDFVPYDHSRVKLKPEVNPNREDYINASIIIDHDPRMPAYIATQGPLPHTIADFWQMVWENGCTVIVMMTALLEDGEQQCERYWPDEGSSLYNIYEVNLVSEHIWCKDFLVRSFYLKNVQTQETRTLTQFHLLSWPAQGIPTSTRPLLDFRRKVNKCYRGRSCPIIVHCSEGTGRTGTYILIDMVLNRMAKGVKEIDIAATLEHIRDQRQSMVRTKDQFEFALTAVAEEVNAILKALPQ
uniref:Protein tyrosine phosphatase receptor type N n=1 Tax=Astyanax mexicanus TaxID=7994 RepID=A0A8B9LV78_ASTMX